MAASTPSPPYGVWAEKSFLEALASKYAPQVLAANPIKFDAPPVLRKKFWVTPTEALATFGPDVTFKSGSDSSALDLYERPSTLVDLLELATEQNKETRIVLVCPPPSVVERLADAMLEQMDSLSQFASLSFLSVQTMLAFPLLTGSIRCSVRRASLTSTTVC